MKQWLISDENERESRDVLQVTLAELEQFQLDTTMVKDLCEGYLRYLDYLGAIDPPYDKAGRAADREQWPDFGFIGRDQAPLLASFFVVRFLCDVCGLPRDQASRYDQKVVAAEIRLNAGIANCSANQAGR